MIIRWSDQAKLTYNEIIGDILNKWNPNIAEEFENITNSLLNNLVLHKKLCPPSKKKNLRKCVIHKNISLIYQVDKNKIELITFIDNRSGHHF